jgi:hypothetical protein
MASRSAEREKLAQAIARHTERAGRLERLRTALHQAERDSVEAFHLTQSREQELAEAERTSPANLAMVALGEIAATDVGSLVDQAERRLEEARAKHQEKHELRDALRLEITAQDQRCGFSEMNVNEAVNAVIAAEPEPLALIAETMSIFAALSSHVAAVEEIGGLRLPREYDWVILLAGRLRADVMAIGRPLPEVPQLAPAWAAALQQLRSDPDTELPKIRVAGP